MSSGNFLDYVNVPATIGIVVSSRYATLTELDTVYGAEDLYTMLEIISIDTHNQRVAQRAKD